MIFDIGRNAVNCETIAVSCPDGIERVFNWSNVEVVYRGIPLANSLLTFVLQCDGMVDPDGVPVADAIRRNLDAKHGRVVQTGK